MIGQLGQSRVRADKNCRAIRKVTAANGRVGSFSTEAILPHRRPLGLRATWSYAKAWKLVEPPAGETKLKLDVLSVYVAVGSHTTKERSDIFRKRGARWSTIGDNTPTSGMDRCCARA